MVGVVGAGAVFKVASLCVDTDTSLHHERKRLGRSVRMERRLRLETSFLRYKLALLRKQRGETAAQHGAVIKAHVTSRRAAAKPHSGEYIVADSDSDGDADVHTMLTRAQRVDCGAPAELESASASGTVTVQVPKRPTNGYLCYCAQMRPMILKVACEGNAVKQAEMQRLLSQVWKEMPSNLKKFYITLYEEDKKRYRQQMKVYEAMSSEQVQSEKDAVFTVPNYLTNIPRFLFQVVEKALRRNEDDSIDVLPSEIHRISEDLTEEDLEKLTEKELPADLDSTEV